MLNKLIISSSLVISLAGTPLLANANDDVYAKFPVTLKEYKGTKTNTVSYSGQIARHTLHDSLKKLAGKGNGKPNSELRAQMMSYFSGKEGGRSIIAPASKGDFIVKQVNVDQISKKKNISGKTYKGTINGMPNNMTGPELVKFWIEKASSANKGVDRANGYNYPQLISKFIIGGMMYNQAVDNYLDEKLSADTKPNNKPYKKGAHYTGKEHSWDEGFGYFGAPAHTLTLTPADVYAIAKRKKGAIKKADYNGDGKVDLKTEMTFAPAYYASGYDKAGKGKSYLHTITKAFLVGRKLIASVGGEKLTDQQRALLREYAAVIAKNWEMVLAESVHKYAGSVYNDMEKLKTIMDAKGDTTKMESKYLKHWGELKGFALGLQTGKGNLGETATKLNRMIGAGPVLINSSQVVDIDSKSNYVRDQANWGEYMLHMAKVQKLMVDKFGIKVRTKSITGDLASLAKKLGAGNTAEND
ncbi:MAG: DUF4856 domain-containing protein [Rhodospirillaceae bacterium TMED8]|nr:DUF4856 domain-containing protein [Magnetovibrio sp.]OUT48559.1 MAG: DUF4856 domain-containing protein [Rhodospirillaceae bacterium TMED8]